MKMTKLMYVLLAAPLCFSSACELIGGNEQDLTESSLKGKDTPNKDESKPDDTGGKEEAKDDGEKGSYGKGEDGAKDEGPAQCKPINKEYEDGCANPRWLDTDKDGCIDQFVCEEEAAEGDGGGKGEDGACKPMPDWLASCKTPYTEDRDGDGCIDLIACGDGEETGGKDPEPGMCKPIDEDAAKGCADPRWEDRDGDGCIDLYHCADGAKEMTKSDAK